MSPARRSRSGQRNRDGRNRDSRRTSRRTSRHPGGPSAGHYGPPGPGRARRDTVDARSAEPARGLARAGRADRRRIRHRQGQAARQLGAEQPPDLDPGYQGRLKEHRMSKPFKGTINVDIRDSAYPIGSRSSRRRPPDGAPSVVYIVLDDVGSRPCRVTEARSRRRTSTGSRTTDPLHAVAHHGAVLRRPGRACSPAATTPATRWRASTEAAIGFPNASGTIPPENGMLPRDPRRARLEHLHGGQVGTCARRWR